MRIIAGELRGRVLKSPKGSDIRPTSDKVKEAVFSILYPWMDGLSPVCMDVFAGSGSLGLEAISRGASKVYFSDASRESLALARENAESCGVSDRCVFLAGDFRSNIRRLRQDIDIFFVDPPYAAKLVPQALECIDLAGVCPPGGIVVCEHSHKDQLQEEYAGFTAIKQRRYGATGITIYERNI